MTTDDPADNEPRNRRAGDRRGATVASELRRSVRVLSAATLGLFAVVVIAVILVRADAMQSRDALCAFRGDLAERVAGSEQFLKEHPDGFAGITAATIRNGLTNQKATVRSLAGLNCGR